MAVQEVTAPKSFFQHHKLGELIGKRHRTVIDIGADDTVEKALHLMNDYRILSLPVRDPRVKGMYCGIINIVDIVTATVFAPIFSTYNTDDSFAQVDDKVLDKVLDQVLELDAFKKPVKSLLGLSEEPQMIYDADDTLEAVAKAFCSGVHRVIVRSKKEPHTTLISQTDLVRLMAFSLLEDGLKDLATTSLIKLGFAFDKSRVVSVSEKSTALTAFRAMIRGGVSAMPVLDSKEEIVDSISLSDLRGLNRESFYRVLDNVVEFVNAVAPKYEDSKEGNVIKVARKPVTVTENATLIDVLKLMNLNDVHRVWVVDGKTVIGAISMTDIVTAAYKYKRVQMEVVKD